ncbi:AzlD domain-containing protein [Vibrio profundum]|uniref:AzlD domain-containing protein n=1 Tax=Vibrio profundum TaxID=2910247 RepID=UPI003D1077A9
MIGHFNLILIGMAAITFGCRYLFFSQSLPIKLNESSRKLLRFTAPSVLTSMWAPIVFGLHGNHDGNMINSPYLYAGVITIMISLKVKNTFIVVSSGMATFIILKYVTQI